MTSPDLLRELRKVYLDAYADAPRGPSDASANAALLAVYERGRRDGATQQRESDRDYMRTAYRANPWRVPLVSDHIADAGKKIEEPT